MRIGRHGIDFHIQLLQHFIMLAQIFKLSRANECEVCRIEKEYSPLALHIFVSDVEEVFACLKCSGFERLDSASDNSHWFPFLDCFAVEFRRPK